MKTGVLLPGAGLVDSSLSCTTNVYLGVVAPFDESTPFTCYIKFLSDKQLVNELSAHELAREVGLLVPRALLASVMKADYPDAPVYQGESETGYAFVTESLDLDDMRRRFSNEETAWSRLRQHWPSWASAAAFDEWIANSDRHEGNLLIGEKGQVWLIDHDKAHTGTAWDAAHLSRVGAVKLDNMIATHLSNSMHERELSVEAAKVEDFESRIAEFDVLSLLENSGARSFLNSDDWIALINFLTVRRAAVADNIKARFGLLL